jgi:hypothetical protein
MRVEPSTSRPLSTEPSPRRAGGSGYSIADSAKNAWTDALGDRLDDLALAGAAAVLEDDANLPPFRDDPQLQLDRFGVQLRELALTGFSRSVCRATRTAPARDSIFATVSLLTLQHLPCLAFTSYTCSTRKARAG